jgi:hypothetical protein
MGFTSFTGNPAVIDGFHKLPRKSSCYRWVSQASQEIQLLAMGFTSFTGNPAVIDGFLSLFMDFYWFRWVSIAVIPLSIEQCY